MEVPNIELYGDHSDFFRDFIHKNKTINNKYSHRYFAAKLNWPDSLLSDLISGRKSLTISRCLQFSKFVELNDFQTEYLIYLCLSKSNNPLVNRHFDETIKKRMNVSSHEYFKSNQISDFSTDFAAVAIFDYLRMTNRLTSFAEIIEALPNFNLDLSQLETCLDLMEKQKLIKLDPAEKVAAVIKQNLSFGLKLARSKPTVLAVFSKSTENILSFLKYPTDGKFTVNTGFCIIQKTDIEQVETRLIAFRNWLTSLESNAVSSSLEEKTLYQYDLNLFPISKSKFR